MWDGRESAPPDDAKDQLSRQPANCGPILRSRPSTQRPVMRRCDVPTPAQVQDIVSFEMSLRTAQAYDFHAGDLGSNGAAGGPAALASQEFFVGINDSFPPSFGFNPTGGPFNPDIFNLFSAWIIALSQPGQHCARRGPIQFEAHHNFRRRRHQR